MNTWRDALVPSLVAWYRENRRRLPWREQPTPYRVWVSEVMLQQTRVQAVCEYFIRWMNALPTIEALAQAEEQQYLKLWQGLGYYSRVRSLHRAAVQVCQQYGGNLPADVAALRSLPGIGAYTAGAIASIAFGIAEPAVDGNVLRVCARLQNDFSPITTPAFLKQTYHTLIDCIPHDCPGDFNQALMELGATVCLPNGAPLCDRCPVQHLCAGFHMGNAAALPIRPAKKPRRIEQRTVLLLRYEGKVGVRRRPARGLLAGLWEFPSLDGALSPADLRAYAQEHGWDIKGILSLPNAKHIFTHIEWHMTGYELTLRAPLDKIQFVSPYQIHERYAIPSAFCAFLSLLENEQQALLLP